MQSIGPRRPKEQSPKEPFSVYLEPLKGEIDLDEVEKLALERLSGLIRFLFLLSAIQFGFFVFQR